MKDEGKHPEDREEFTREVMKGRISGAIAWRMDEGIESRAQVVGRWERRSWETSVSVRGETEGRQGARAEREVQRGGTERGGAEVNELRVSTIFSSKNTAKSSAVMGD